MSEDEPLEPIAPEPATAPTEPMAAPTEPLVVDVPTTESAAAGSPSGPPPWGEPGSQPGSGGGSSTVAVPKWVLFLVGAVAIGILSFAVGFGVGWVAAPGDDDHDRSARPNREFTPPDGNRGDGSGQLPTLPTLPNRGASSAFLGVATVRSTDPAGARVEQVVPDSPAAGAGLEEDDVITKVDGDPVTSPSQLASRIVEHDAGDEVTLTYVRDGRTETEDVTLVRRGTLEPSTPSTTAPEN